MVYACNGLLAILWNFQLQLSGFYTCIFRYFYLTTNIISLVENEEAFECQDEIPMRLDNDIRFGEYIPKCKRLKYVYDFGDF